MMIKTSKGFTLIELVVVIVVIAILAAVAVPKYVDIKEAAYKASNQAIANALISGSTINYAVCQADPASTKCVNLSLATGCDDTKISGLLKTALPAGTTLIGSLNMANGEGCSVHNDKASAAEDVPFKLEF